MNEDKKIEVGDIVGCNEVDGSYYYRVLKERKFFKDNKMVVDYELAPLNKIIYKEKSELIILE